MTRHRWGDKVAITPNKTERECLNGCDFAHWCRELQFEGEQFYTRFEVHPEHWRDDFDKGLTPRQALEAVFEGVFETKRRQALQ